MKSKDCKINQVYRGSLFTFIFSIIMFFFRGGGHKNSKTKSWKKETFSACRRCKLEELTWDYKRPNQNDVYFLFIYWYLSFLLSFFKGIIGRCRLGYLYIYIYTYQNEFFWLLFGVFWLVWTYFIEYSIKGKFSN